MTASEHRETEEKSDNGVLIKDTILLAHKQNYVQFFSYDSQDHKEYRDEKEASFQLSLKRKFLDSIFGYNIDFFAAYTQKSFWQVYDDKHSRPFRETNYNPELFISSNFPDELRKYYLRNWNIGIEHESNGQSTYTSRSWNRAYLKLFLKKGGIRGDLKVWGRFSEDKKRDINDPHGDDNPDITDYYGYAELNLFYAFSDNEAGVFLRKNAVGAVLTKPFGENQYLFVKYFEGYGESLIDYNEKTQKLGFGIMLNR